MFKTEHWNHSFVLDVHNFFGFIYYIENKLSGKKYIGKKQYYSYKAGKKHKESDWKKYFSSSKHLNEDIMKFGIDNFYFEILFECKTRGDLTYAESNLQHKNNVLTERDEYGERSWYNASIAAIKFIPKAEHSVESKKKMSTTKKKMYDAGLIDIPIMTKDKWSEDRIKRQSEMLKEMWKNDPKFGVRNYSLEERLELSTKLSGKGNPMYGRKHSQDTLGLLSQQRQGVKQTEEHINKRVLKNIGQKRTDDFKLKQSERIRGIKKPKQICKFCEKEMSIMNFKKYGHHYGKCVGNSLDVVVDI